LTVNAVDSVQIIGRSANGRVASGLFTQTENTGDGGVLRINTRNLIIRDGAQVSSGGFLGEGRGGSLTINATGSVQVIGSSIDGRFPSGLFTQTRNSGNAGNLKIDTRNLIVRNGAQVEVGTLGKGAGGSLMVNATDSVQIIGSSADGQFPSSLSAATRASGNAGDLILKTRQLTIEDNGQITSRSTATGIAGNIELQADSLALEGEGSSILADTVSTDGGNITLQVNDRLLLRNGSQISTTAGTERAGGNGGNIKIDTPFLIAVPLENSDITANAFEGRGGRIEIDAQGIFGIQERDRETDFSDITASSKLGLQGTVEIDNPNTDPSRTIVNLPIQPLETQVVQACQPGTNQYQSEFVVTGRGGLPPSPQEPLSTESIGVDWVSLNPDVASESKPEQTQENLPNSSSVETNNTTTSKPIIEAQGMVVGSNGKIILTAQTSADTSNNSWFLPHSCKGS
jgi:large exoprotein involved in heme utilization and adhesion